MGKGTVVIYMDNTTDKSPIALGLSILAAEKGQKAVIIRFQNRMNLSEYEQRLEPEIKVFCFQDLDNGIHFARKVLLTGECDLLILEDILGWMKRDIQIATEISKLIEQSNESECIVLTGSKTVDFYNLKADRIFQMIEK